MRFVSPVLLAAAFWSCATDAWTKPAFHDANGSALYVIELTDDAYAALAPQYAQPVSRAGIAAHHDTRTIQAVRALERQFGFRQQGFTSIISHKVSAFLNAGQLKAIQASPFVRAVHEESAFVFSDLPHAVYPPPWSDAPSWGTQTLSWGRTAVNGKTVDGDVAPFVYLVDAGVGAHEDLPPITYLDVQGAGFPVVGCYPHATHVAGIVAAKYDDRGSAGVAAGARIVSASVGTVDRGVCADTDSAATVREMGILQAMEAVYVHIRYNGRTAVVNMSLNPRDPDGAPSPSSALMDEMRKLASPAFMYPGAVFVQSAGNQLQDACNFAYGPASPTDGILVVGAAAENGRQVSYRVDNWPFASAIDGSNFGTCVEVYAPGARIYSTWGPNVTYIPTEPSTYQQQGVVYTNYVRLSGTSMAAPHIAGLAAWILAGNPAFTPAQVESRIRTYMFPPGIPETDPWMAQIFDNAHSDLDGNRKADMLYRNDGTGQLWRLGMNGTAIATNGPDYSPYDASWRVVAHADFDADGRSDVLWRNSTTGQLSMFLQGTSGPRTFYTEANPDWKIVQSADVDGDGKADLLWWNAATGQAYLMLMDGANIRGQGIVYTEPNVDWKLVGAGDFAGSGVRNQVLWRNRSTGVVVLMTIFATPGRYAQSQTRIYEEPNTAWKIVATADFNGDGKTDILWWNSVTGQVYMHLMNGSAIVSQGLVYQEPNVDWKIVDAADYDADGKADLLWRNDATGDVFMFLMNGLAIRSLALVYQESNTAWKIMGPWQYGSTNGILP